MSARAKILIVEDDPVMAKILRVVLEKVGYAIEVAGDGVAALEVLESNAIDAVVTDLRMPRMGGRDLCGRIRADTRWAELPILVVSGSKLETLAWLDGFKEIELLEKPVHTAALIAGVERCLAG